MRESSTLSAHQADGASQPAFVIGEGFRVVGGVENAALPEARIDTRVSGPARATA